MIKAIEAIKHWLVVGKFPTSPPGTVTVGGKTIVVQPLRMRQVGPFWQAIRGPFDLVLEGDYHAVLDRYPGEIIAAICAATDLERPFVENLSAPEFLALAEAVLDLNLRHIAEDVLPQLTRLSRTVADFMVRHQAAGSADPVH